MGRFNKTDGVELFAKEDLHSFLESRKSLVKEAIRAIEEDELVENDETQLSQHFFKEFGLEPLSFDFDAIEIVEQGPKKIDVTGDHRFAYDLDSLQGMKPLADGFYYKLAVPFSGSSDLLLYRTQSWSAPIKAEILSEEIVINFEDASFTPEILADHKKQLISVLTHYMTWVQNQTSAYNRWLEQETAELVVQQKTKMKQRQEMLVAVGLKVRQRKVQPENISQPIIRKQTAIATATNENISNIEPALEQAVYDEILSICLNMAKVMELSPRAFRAIDEEDLRFHFLVQLNGVFEGQATGETFNLGGKTDIVIKTGNNNLFIAECKFWAGEKAYLETIDQLMRYVSWHDTKTAIIVFNRNKNFSAVLHQIRNSTLKHPHCLAAIADYGGETSFRFVFKHGQDEAKKFMVTILAFDVPSD